MRDRNLLDSLEWFGSIRNVVHRVKDVSAVIPRSAGIANADHNIFQDYESLLMLKGLAFYLLRADGSLAVFAVFAVIAVHDLSIVAEASNEKPVETGYEPNGSRCPAVKRLV